MKNKLIIGTITLGLMTQMGWSQAKPKSIIFKPGESSATATGALNGPEDEARFALKLKKGQKLEVSSEQSVSIYVDFPNGEGDGAPGGIETEPLPQDGDYIITVTQISKGDAWKGKFAIKVTANPVAKTTGNKTATSPADSAPSETKPSGTRVQFAKGETSSYVTKEIPANGSVDFLMNVKKGQTIGYTIGYDFKDSDVDAFLTEPGLQDISQTAAPKEPKEFKVNESGDHRLTVNNTTRKKVTITLYVDVE